MKKGRDIVTFQEPPATAEEKALAKVFQDLSCAINTRGIEALAKILAPQAEMRHTPGEPKPRDQYLEEMKQVLDNIKAIEYRDIVFRKIDKQRWNAHCESRLYLRTRFTPITASRYFRLVNIDGNFYIEESGFI